MGKSMIWRGGEGWVRRVERRARGFGGWRERDPGARARARVYRRERAFDEALIPWLRLLAARCAASEGFFLRSFKDGLRLLCARVCRWDWPRLSAYWFGIFFRVGNFLPRIRLGIHVRSYVCTRMNESFTRVGRSRGILEGCALEIYYSEWVQTEFFIFGRGVSYFAPFFASSNETISLIEALDTLFVRNYCHGEIRAKCVWPKPACFYLNF